MTEGQPPLVLQAIEALKRGERDAATALLEQDLREGPPVAHRWRSVALLAAKIGEIDLALEAARRDSLAGTLEPLAHYWGMLATYGRPDEALAEVARLEPALQEHPAVLHFRGTIAGEQGRFEEAQALFRRALARDPEGLPTWFALAMIKTFGAGDRDLAAMEKLASHAARAEPATHARFLYALGKAWDDIGDVDRAFDHFTRGAAIRRRQEPYDPAPAEAFAERALRDFTPEALRRLTPSRAQGQRSLFVTGLPRSGTTLVQQMLAAHSAVAGGGEVNLFKLALIPTVDFSLDGALAYQARSMSDDPWGDVARDYARLIDMRFRSPLLAVDKSLNQAALIPLLLHSQPDARIVWLRRRAEDTALSCFRTFFTAIPWSWSLTGIARHFRMEDRYFEHLRAMYPDRILVVPYEELVRDPRSWSARMLAHFGLDEEPGVHDFHRDTRNIRTASVRQVRAPVSTDRIGQAEAYGRHMEEFRRAYQG